MNIVDLQPATGAGLSGRLIFEVMMRRAPKPPQAVSDQEKTWLDTQRIFFERVSVRIGGKARRLPLIQTYHYSLVNAAATGDISAVRELRYLVRKLEKDHALEQAAPQPEKHPLFKELQENRELATFANYNYSLFYVSMLPEFVERYEARYGKNATMWDVKPFWLDCDPLWQRLQAVSTTNKRKAKQGKDYKVGRGKPPIDHQWPKGQSGNPTGRPRRDSYEILRECWSEKVLVQTSDGTERYLTKYALSVRQAISRAQGGEPGARRLVRSLIEDLEERGLFRPPAPPPRRSRRPSAAERENLGKSLQIVFVQLVKESLLELFEAQFGPVEEFITRAERECQDYLQDEQFASHHRDLITRHQARGLQKTNLSKELCLSNDIEDYEEGIGSLEDVETISMAKPISKRGPNGIVERG